jgi:hypothetical protein
MQVCLAVNQGVNSVRDTLKFTNAARNIAVFVQVKRAVVAL